VISPNLGYSGDEDQGLMGSLAVLMKTGLFSVNGGTSDKPFYEISSPIFNKVTLAPCNLFYLGSSYIEAKNNGPQSCYIQSAMLNGKPLNQSWILHESLSRREK